MTTPRNIKASVINDLRTYAIHRKHMEKSEMSEVKDYALDCGRHSEVSTDAMDAMINALAAFEGDEK